MNKKIHPVIFWTPRILGIAFILFLMLFSLDVFDMGLTAGQIAIGLFMHNIPALILAMVLWIAWKYEIVGGTVFILAGLAYMALSTARETFDPWFMALAISLILAVPALLIGILFLIGWFKKKKINRI